MMLTCPIHLVITEVGIALFKEKPTALFPYSEMDSDQRYFIEEVVQSCLLQCNRTTQLPPPAALNDAKGLPYYHLYHHAIVQMGGGCILYTRRKPSSACAETPAPSATDPKKKRQKQSSSVVLLSEAASQKQPLVARSAILSAMCDCIFASKDYGDAGVLKSVCSIVLQRVSCMTALDQEDQRKVHEYMEELCRQYSSQQVA
jgi:hypothetical protein